MVWDLHITDSGKTVVGRLRKTGCVLVQVGTAELPIFARSFSAVVCEPDTAVPRPSYLEGRSCADEPAAAYLTTSCFAESSMTASTFCNYCCSATQPPHLLLCLELSTTQLLTYLQTRL